MTITNFLTVDVEDYFQVSAFENVSPPSAWEHFESRVDRNTRKVLDMLDERGITATFFVLGWVARRLPSLSREIIHRGHEVASHGYWHRRIATQSRREFREDVRSSKSILEDQTGVRVLGYRAPSYSITLGTLWAYDELRDAGYTYDSSVFPIHHDIYGIPRWPRFPFYLVRDETGHWSPEETPPRGATRGAGPRMYEVPVSTVRLAGCNIPVAGGGYFRLLPYRVTRRGLKRINDGDKHPFVFYIHPWEFDPGQPRMAGAGLRSRFRHYFNLGSTETRFRRLIEDFLFAPLRQGSAGVPSLGDGRLDTGYGC